MMISEIVYSKYSQAMFDIAIDLDQLEPIGRELCFIRDTLQLNQALRQFLVHPRVPQRSKKHVIHEIFSDDLSPMVLQFLYVIIDRGREAALIPAINGFIALSREARNVALAKVRITRPLAAAEKQKLVAGLERLTGKKIEPSYYVDSSLIGGMVIQIGDRLIDGSLSRQLKNMEYTLLQADVTNEVTDE